MTIANADHRRLRPAGRVQLVAAAVLVVLTFTGGAAMAVHGTAVATAAPPTDVTRAEVDAPEPAPGPAPGPEPDDGSFTIEELAAGTVPQQVQDRFWQTQLDVILAAPCPTGPDRGAIAVTLYLGADAAWTARLLDAAAEHATACAA